MQTPRWHFYENSEGLSNINARAYSSLDKSSVRIDNLPRDMGITIAHEMTKRLDAMGSTGREFNNKNYLLGNDLSDGLRKSLSGEPVVFETTPALGNFVVQLSLPERKEMEELGITKGMYSLQARLHEGTLMGNKTPEELKQILQLGYISLFERADFFPSEEEIDIERKLDQLGVSIPSDRLIKAEIEEDEKKEIEVVKTMLMNLGVKGIEPELLTTLCEVKKWDSIAVTDLYLYVVVRKQQKGHPFPGIFLNDLVQATDKLIADKLRDDQEKQSYRIYESLGFKEGEIQRRYELYEGDNKRKLSVRYIAWLASQDFMKGFSLEVAKKLSAGEKLPNIKLFELATSHVYQQYRQHRNNRHDVYDLSIDWERDDYETAQNFLRTALMLCLDIFYDQDIARFNTPK
jgi:hypothetical protein